MLPIGLLVLSFAAFAAAAWTIADGDDLTGLYFVAVAAVALRAEQRIALAGAT